MSVTVKEDGVTMRRREERSVRLVDERWEDFWEELLERALAMDVLEV